ncbi:hypothetical protein MTO96_002098 [Rhipicephalus appendiculatus]
MVAGAVPRQTLYARVPWRGQASGAIEGDLPPSLFQRDTGGKAARSGSRNDDDAAVGRDQRIACARTQETGLCSITEGRRFAAPDNAGPLSLTHTLTGLVSALRT